MTLSVDQYRSHWYQTSLLLKLDKGQNEAMRGVLETTKDTPAEAMHYLLDLPSMETRHMIERVKSHLSGMQNHKSAFHDAVKEEKSADWQDESHG